VVFANVGIENSRHLVRPTLICLLISLILQALILLTTTPNRRPRWHVCLAFIGFVVAISWISTIAGEVVGVLKAIGIIINASDAILGLTIFAVGNSLGDLVANFTVATSIGYPYMALSACFGGPMLNILLGIGVSGIYMTVHKANDKVAKHPGRKIKYQPYIVEIDRSLIVSGIALLVGLVSLLVVMPLRKWTMDRSVAAGLITLWVVATLGNVLSEWLLEKSPSTMNG